MATEPHPSDDPRSVDESTDVALHETDEDRYWDASMALRWKGSRQVFERASDLCGSDSAAERSVGADIHGQLGVPERTFPEESCAMLRAMLKDENAGVHHCHRSKCAVRPVRAAWMVLRRRCR